MQAQQIIHLGQLDPIDYEGAFRIYLDAFGDIELAHKAKSASLKRFVDWRIANHKQ